MNHKVAIQGVQSSFHELAAMKFYGPDIDTIECLSFQCIFDVLESNEAERAVMAIENSVAGSILPNYARLRDSNLTIIGEVFLRIEMNLLALPGQSIVNLKEVHSHPIAILQTAKFFREHTNITIVESPDTAFSAREISEGEILGRGALGSSEAAELYNLEILARGVETNKRNFTRFLVLEKSSNHHEEEISKASWSFRTTHESGSLAKALTTLGEHDINLTKIQSLPVLGEEWKYYFYADLEFDNAPSYHAAKKMIEPYIYDLKILGEYKKGEKYL